LADDMSYIITVYISITGRMDRVPQDIIRIPYTTLFRSDYEAGQTSFAVEVTASDGLHPVARTFTVNLTDQNDNAPVWATSATQSEGENTRLVSSQCET